jgi:hypothetical protein
MANGRTPEEIRQVRYETLVALKMIYPAALQADQILRSLLSLFPTLEWECFRRDLIYLAEKNYVQRVVAQSEPDARLTPWRKRWFRLTARGVELAEDLIRDPALGS